MQTIPTLKTRQQIAEELGIDRKTLYNKIKKANLQISKGLLIPEDQYKIFKLFGKELPVKDKNTEEI